jgi:hypothetical protein
MAISKVNPNSLSLSGELSSGNPLVTIDSTGTSSNEGHALKVIASGRGSGINDVSILSVHNANGELLRVQNAGGISFNGDTAAANALDDYEEGTFTPTYIGSTTNPTITYDRQNGHYVKIGRQVIATVEIRTDAVSGGSGSIYVGGLPFTPVTVSGQVRSGTANVGYSSAFNGSTPQTAYVNGSFNAVILGTNSGTDARGPLETSISVSNLGTGTNDNFLMLTVIYIAS